MDFKQFFFALPVAERDAFAQQAGSTRGVLTQVAYRNKDIELGFADVIVTLAGGEVSLDDLPLTANAARQRAIRSGQAPRGREPTTTPGALDEAVQGG